MKKTMILAVVLMISLTTIAQDKKIKIGAFGAIPMGDTKDVVSTGFGFSGTILFEVSDKFDLGFASGISFFEGKEETRTNKFKYENAKYIPLTVAFNFNATENLYFGSDIGYAIGIGDGIKSGFHFNPRIGYQISKLIGINTSYTGLLVKNTWKSLNFGLEFNL